MLFRSDLLFKDVQSDGTTEEMVRQHDYILVVLRALISPWGSRERVCAICSSRFVFELDVVLRNEWKISSNTPAQLLSMSVLREVVMVCVTVPRDRGSK